MNTSGGNAAPWGYAFARVNAGGNPRPEFQNHFGGKGSPNLFVSCVARVARMTATLQTPKREATIAPFEIPPRVIVAPIEPETIRLPKPGEHEPYFGLARSALNELILPTPRNKFKPPVKSFCLRQKGARTCIRLISFSSLKSHILAQADTPDGREGA